MDPVRVHRTHVGNTFTAMHELQSFLHEQDAKNAAAVLNVYRNEVRKLLA